ncbi:hypothetical protein MPSEU_000896200 [Mayamaea pseudoterrestris]|nr:hypothetical protein MPSEU_000896200 [Mayamaea pseudoterrestris]
MQVRPLMVLISLNMCKFCMSFSILLPPRKATILAGRRTAAFHSTTACKLNRFLFRMEEDIQEDRESRLRTITLPQDDYRTLHAAKVLGAQSGDTLRAGLVSCNEHDGLVTDSATIEWCPQGSIKKAQPTRNGDPPGLLKIHLHDLQPAPPTSVPPVSLMLALPRPLQLGRMLPMISQMGVDHVILTESSKVPKDYWGSQLLRQPHLMTDKLLQGLEQAGDVRMPKLTIVRNLCRFLEHDLDRLFPIDEYARVVAHPTRITDPVPAKRLRECKLPNNNVRKILVAVGPEGGWKEPDELELLTSRAFEQITMGTRVLRSDCAVVSLMSLAHDVCSDSRYR